MWKTFTLLLVFIFYKNYVEATYNTGIKTRVYEQHQPITHAYHHQHHQPYTPTHGHYNQYIGGSNDKDYQSSITPHYVHADNSYQQQPQPQQQQRENDNYHQSPIAQQTHYRQRQQQPEQSIYERNGNSQTQITGNWQNSENSVTEYYTGCPSGHTGQLPYAYDCRRFLNCWNGRGHIQTCSVGTVFNPETLECDRPDKVKCEAALGVLGVQSVGKSSPSTSQGSLKQSNQPNYKAGRYTDQNVEVLCPVGAEGLQPHPSDCTRFINCANGNMHIQQCGPGTAYSIEMKVCDFKNKVDCSGREAEDQPPAPRQANNEISCPLDASGLYPHPNDCTKFLQCSNGETFIQDCGPGTAFDSVRLLCDYRHKVKCCSSCTWSETDSAVFATENIQDKVTSQSLTPTSRAQQEDLPHTADILCLNGITGLFPYPFDYTKFIHCKNGNTAIQNCVPETAFSISKGYCESLDDISKTDHVMYIVSQVSYEYSQTLITCPPGTEGVHLYPFNAELFVKCVKSQMKIVPCNNAHVFSITRRTCLPLAQVLKSERVRLLSELEPMNNYRVTDENYSMKTMIYCPGGLTGTYPHPFDSTKYLKCMRGRLMSESCASGQAFSLSRKVCSLKEEMNADDYVPQAKSTYGQEWRVTDIEITHGSIDGLTYLMCPPGLNGYFLHPFDCTKYIECSNGITTVDNCLNGAVFSISRKECIPRDKVEAYDRVEYMTSTKNEFSNEPTNQYHHDLGISCTPGTFGIYPHPQDCRKYIRCANGRISVENCAAGQVFSLTKGFCHNENEVDAKDRSSYNRGFSVTQNNYKTPATTTTSNTGFQTGFYHPINIPQQSLSPPPATAINPPSAVLSPPLPSSVNTVANENISCPPGSSGHYPHPFDCTKFLMCSNGETYVKDCGPGTAWNKEMEVCDFKGNVGCTESSSTASVTTSSTQHRCPPGVEGLYQHPYDWRKYLVCNHGQTIVMDCAPGTVFSLSRKTCDIEANVLNTDRCNNGVNISDNDYKNYNNRDSKPHHNTQSSNPGATQTQPHVQVNENRWSHMNSPRPQSSTWQQNSHTRNYNQPNRPEVTPVWSGTAVHVDQHNPSHTIMHEEGSFEPNRNYNRPMYNTPLAPLKPTTTTTTSTIVYAQPVGSQEDSKELFSITPTKPKNAFDSQYFPIVNRQNHTRHLNTWTPIRPVDIPANSRPDLMPSHQGESTVYTNTRLQIPISSHLMPPHQSQQQPFPQSSYNLPAGRPQDQRPAIHLIPSYDNEDLGQRPLPVSDLKINNINIDQLPGQVAYNLNDFDQLPSGSSKHDIRDDFNLYGGLQPPLDSSLTTTTPKSSLDPYEQTTQLPLPPKSTTPTHRILGYPQLSNATIQTFPHQPHYSPPYSEVAHSSNASWVGRKTPQHFAIKPIYRDPSNNENIHLKITSTPLPQYNIPNHSPYSNEEHEEDNPALEDEEAAMKAALKLLLKPYIDSESKIDADVAERAQSHIMNLVSNSDRDTITATTTHKSLLNKIATTPHPQDVELILAGEQHNLIGVTTTQTGNDETSTSYNLYQAPLPSERSNVKSSMSTHDHNINWYDTQDPHNFKSQHKLIGVTTTQTGNDETSTSYNLYQAPLQSERSNVKSSMSTHDHNINWYDSRDPHNFKLQHSREFHAKNPNLPNPFNNPVSSYNLPAEATTPKTYNWDLRFGGKCPFDCGDGKCVEQHQVCDGVNNCGNREDEQNCEHLGYELRLTGGQSSNMGRVEVKILGKWGYVCDDKFGLRDADVVCRELGFKMGAMEVRGNSYYAPSTVDVYFAMDEVECKGNETLLRECDFKGWGVNNCGPDEVVGVVCKVPKLKCPDNYWLCSKSKECIPTAFLCDVTPDCEDGSDESEEVCNAPIKYRLEGGRNSNEGRLEVFYRGEWGTVCDDDFGLKEAQVVCNSFGLYGKAEIVKNIYGPGSGPIWLDQISCLGNETKIDECTHWSWGENNCNHTEDVGLKCTAGPKPNNSKVVKPLTDDSLTQEKDLESTLQFEQSELDDLGLYQGLWQRSSKAIHSQKKCGHFKSNLLDEYEHPEERVVNGTIAKRGRHPWQATIRTRGRGGISSHWCGAVIISKKLVLTAAHCLAGYPKGSYFVRLGDHYANIAESSEVDSNIDNWYIHEKFRDQKHMNNDIALILLKSPVRFNDYVQPICLPEKGATLETNRMCTISGWGSIKSGTSTPSNILRSAQVPILADEVCRQKNVYANAMTEGMFCAGFLDESADACDGDSGGPLVCSDEDGETLYGIISWGQHCGYANHPGVYVRVEKYIDWIYDKINLMTQQGKL